MQLPVGILRPSSYSSVLQCLRKGMPNASFVVQPSPYEMQSARAMLQRTLHLLLVLVARPSRAWLDSCQCLLCALVSWSFSLLPEPWIYNTSFGILLALQFLLEKLVGLLGLLQVSVFIQNRRGALI